MIDLKLGHSIKYLFAERRWWVKLGIIFLINYAIIAIGALANFFNNSVEKGSIDLKTISSLQSVNPVVWIVLAVVLVIFYVLFALVVSWYTYENTQAGIENRKTRLMWEYSFGENLKRSGKYLLANLIYSFIFGIVIAIVLIVPILQVTSLATSGTGASISPKEAQSMFGLGLLLVLCVAVPIILALSFVFYLVTTPGYLRLFASNTFSQSFKFGSNLKIAKRYFWYFVLFVLISFTFVGVYTTVTFPIALIYASIALINPLLGFFAELIIQAPLTLVLVYFSYFVYPRMVGVFYREVINRESSLSSLKR
jgi:hypothetical protein